VRWPPGSALLLGALALGCGGPDTNGTLTKTTGPNGTVEVSAEWKYESFEVDVDLTLVTRFGPDGCVSVGALVVDDALSARAHYALPATDCSVLELTDTGDIVLQGEATGHDWVTEPLSVDTDAEVITLGPAALTDPDGNPESVRFTLSSPPCPDVPSCKCGLLRRIAGGMNLDLSLGRRC
jgi:hypothetical protein